jgi:hypothetical protein
MGLPWAYVASWLTVDNGMTWSNMFELMLQNRSPDFSANCDCKFASAVMYCHVPFGPASHRRA